MYSSNNLYKPFLMAGFIEEINYNMSYLLFHKNILDNYHNIYANFGHINFIFRIMNLK